MTCTLIKNSKQSSQMYKLNKSIRKYLRAIGSNRDAWRWSSPFQLCELSVSWKNTQLGKKKYKGWLFTLRTLSRLWFLFHCIVEQLWLKFLNFDKDMSLFSAWNRRFCLFSLIYLHECLRQTLHKWMLVPGTSIRYCKFFSSHYKMYFRIHYH